MTMQVKNNNRTVQLCLILLMVVISAFGISCNSGESKKKEDVKLSDVFSEINSDLQQKDNDPAEKEIANIMSGTVQEVLNAERYTYLELLGDADQKYWVAIAKQPINTGDQIIFSDGILKKNFESKEFNRLFETIYLVSRFQRIKNNDIEITSSESKSGVKLNGNTDQLNDSTRPNELFELKEGETAIESILSDPDAYKNKKVVVSGVVFKVNYNIMGKNWVHISQNTAKGPMELTITSMDQVVENQEVTFEGIIYLNKDFGAGYTYDIIMEEAKKL